MYKELIDYLLYSSVKDFTLSGSNPAHDSLNEKERKFLIKKMQDRVKVLS